MREPVRDVVCDANVLIDLEDGGLREAAFRLPVRFHVPVDLYIDELQERHANLRQELRLEELDAGIMENADALFRRYWRINEHDSRALALARSRAWPLLTGDRALRGAAAREDVRVHGTLWVVEQLLETGLISSEQARAAFERMKAAGSRLPWDRARALCRQRRRRTPGGV